MKPVFRRAAAGLVAVLLLAGCGPKAQDDDDVQIIEDEKEQVYILPDGTTVRGGRAAWVRDVKDRLKLGQVDKFMITPDMISNVFGDAFIVPDVPDRFHFLGYTMTANKAANFRMARATWVDPDMREVIFVETSGAFTDPTNDVFVIQEPWCYVPQDQVVKDANGHVITVERKIPWAELTCSASIAYHGVAIAVKSINVPEAEVETLWRSFVESTSAGSN